MYILFILYILYKHNTRIPSITWSGLSTILDSARAMCPRLKIYAPDNYSRGTE